MDRKEFLRNAFAATVGAAIGAKLDWIAPVPVAAAATDVPGIGGTLWSMKVTRGAFVPFDIIMGGSTGNAYYLSRKSPDVLLATPINPVPGEDEPFELHEVDVAVHPSVEKEWPKLSSAFSER